MRKTAFIGHRQIFAKHLPEKLIEAIKTEIKKDCFVFAMGTHGEFDSLALYACRKLRHDYPKMQIEVVLTSLNPIQKNIRFSGLLRFARKDDNAAARALSL